LTDSLEVHIEPHILPWISSDFAVEEGAMRTMKFSEVNANLKAAIDQLIEEGEVAMITGEGAPDTVIMSLAYYNSWMETVYLLGSPANSAHLAKSIAQARAGQVSEHVLLDVDDSQDGIDAKPPILG
jgi:antitoxin YefM